MKKRFIYITICCLCLMLCSGCKAQPDYTLTLTYNNEVIYSQHHNIDFATKCKVFLKYHNSYNNYFDSFINYEEALQAFNPTLSTAIADIETRYKIDPQNATATFNNGTFNYQQEKQGQKLNKLALVSNIIKNFDKNIKIELQTTAILACTTIADLKLQTVLLSEFSTSYSTSSEGRSNNIAVASSAINNTIVAPDAQFSFNNIVGARTKQNGYSSAITIENGEFIEGIGGGVCQVSTTLYNAILLAGCSVINVSHHSLPVSYVQPSFDAMVSEYSDLIFKNTSPYPIYISATTNNKTCKFSIYGYPKYRDCTPVLRSKVTSTIPNYKFIDIVDPAKLPPEQNEKIIKYPVAGLQSEGYIDIYKNSQLIDSTLIRKDTYKPQNGKRIIRQNTQNTIGEQDVL